MSDRWIVLKFGGTSVAGREQWNAISSIVDRRRARGFRVLVVCSAVSGVTNRLVELARNPSDENLLQEVLAIHLSLAEQLGISVDAWLPEAEHELRDCLGRLRHEAYPRDRAALTAMGEWMSTRMGAEFLGQAQDVGWVDAREALEVKPEEGLSAKRRWLSASCEPGFDPELVESWAGAAPILITQGFIARSEDGSTALLGRGGSDTSAALLAGRLGAEQLEIWTDVPGLFSTDPRLMGSARLLGAVDYEEALEMAGGGAKVVHPGCIRAASETNTPVIIRDVSRQHIPGTRICSARSVRDGVKTITCRDEMVVMLLRNLDSRYQVGFIANIGDAFRRHGLSIELVATSEITTTLAMSRETNELSDAELALLVKDLEQLARVEVFDHCVCVNLVGRGARRAFSSLDALARGFETRPLLMASLSANDLCLSLLLRKEDHEAVIREAHEALIPAVGEEQEDGVFGDSWSDIVSGT